VLIGDGAAPLLAANSSTADALAAMHTRLDAIASQINLEGLQTRVLVSAESNSSTARLRTQIEEQTQLYLRLFADDAVTGPRLFTVESNDTGARVGKLAKRHLRVVLWCEHSRLPVHLLDQVPGRGVYTIEMDREWLVKARPWLGLAAQVLRLGADFIPAILKVNLDETQWQSLENRLSLAETTVKELAAAGAGLADNAETGAPITSGGSMAEPTRGQLQALHALLNEQDPDFAGLQRVRDRDRFLWVHPRFAHHYD
jgi:hypothetical protein